MLKKILSLSLAFVSFAIYGQDTAGQKFGFGMLRNQTYTYRVINQDIVRNVRNTPTFITQDTFLAKMNLGWRIAGWDLFYSFKNRFRHKRQRPWDA